MKKNITLKHIAEKVGISTAAVSMILSNKESSRFSKETVEKVFAIASELNYQSPKSSKEKKRILVVCPFLINPYYAILAQSIEQKAIENGCIPTVFTTYWREDREKDILDLIKRNFYDAVIFTMIPMNSNNALEISKIVPTVVIGDHKYDLGLNSVDVDNEHSGKLVAEYLISLNHKKIGYISTEMTEKHSARLIRYEGLKNTYQQLCPEGEVTIFSRPTAPEEQKGINDLEYQIGYSMAEQCVLNHPEITALVGINDMVSYGIVDGLISHGKKIPEDYSICSFDNIYPSRFSTISLTTVDYCIAERGQAACQLTVDKLQRKNEENSITRIEYKTSLKIRNSTGQAKSL